MKPFNCAETIAILEYKQISSDFKMKLPTYYSHINHICISIKCAETNH